MNMGISQTPEGIQLIWVLLKMDYTPVNRGSLLTCSTRIEYEIKISKDHHTMVMGLYRYKSVQSR